MVHQHSNDPMPPQRVSDGFLLSVSLHNQYKVFLLLVFGVGWLAFSTAVLLFILKEESGAGVIFPVVIISIFELFGFLMVGSSLLEIWTNWKLHPAELILPTYPLRLGEICPIYYRRRLRRGTFTKPGEIEARLICDEWVEYTQGTDKVTKTETLHESQLPTRTVVAGERQADYESKIAIPHKELPSFYAPHNKVRWRLLMKLKVPGIPHKCQSEFTLQVLPEVPAQ